MVGNFIGDYVKGSHWKRFPENIQRGIIIHRQIDDFTDRHEKHREAKYLFRPEYGLYSGIVVDFLYDYLLARNWKNYSEKSLKDFADLAHSVLSKNFEQLPTSVQQFLPFLIKNRRLESYATIEGITESMNIMSNYSSLPAKSEFAARIITENYFFFEENFSSFMKDLIDFINDGYGFGIKIPDSNQNFS